MKKIAQLILPLFFLLYIFLGLLLNLRNFGSCFISQLYNVNSLGLNAVTERFEKAVNDGFHNKAVLVDVNGLFQKMLGKNIVNKTVKGRNNKVYSFEHVDKVFDPLQVEQDIAYTKSIMDLAQAYGAYAIYVQHPEKFDGMVDSLPYGKEYRWWDNDNQYVSELREDGYLVLDLRDFDDNKSFYLTDHHWTTLSAFNANRHIMQELNKTHGLTNTDYMTNINNFVQSTYAKAFLGSVGVRTGRYYVGKDDYTLIVPAFDTQLEFYRYGTDHTLSWKLEGSFEDTLINYDILNNPKYNNKYSAYTFDGYIENVIINKMAANEKKVLLVSDSFSRPLQAFMSLNFTELRVLDPQPGRYNESYLDYIREYKPDIVIIMYDYGITENMLSIQ